MKVRSGFVSNSSSSSFVLFGIMIDNDYEYEDLCRKFISEEVINESIKHCTDNDWDVEWGEIWYDNKHICDIDIITDGYSNKIWMGKKLVDGGSDNDHFDKGSLSLDDMAKIKESLKDKLPADKEFKVYYGTYGC